MNANISLLQATSNPNVFYVCNPFSAPPDYQYQPDNCPANTIRIGDIPKVCQRNSFFLCSQFNTHCYKLSELWIPNTLSHSWQNLANPFLWIFLIILFVKVLKFITCSDANNGTCERGQILSTSNYKIVEAYSNSIQNLLDAYPGMESLIECQSVKDAFSEILFKHCKPLKRYAQMVWVSMSFLSVIMVILVLIWITQAHHEQSLHLSDGSVKPHLATGDMLESGAATKSSTA